MANLFELVKGIPAYEAAERNGIYLKRNGSKYWACCPLHGEKTPSMCFYPDGGWYCYGCHRGGDTITLYKELYSLENYDAACRLAGDFGIMIPEREEVVVQKPKGNAFHLEQVLDRYKGQQWDKFCSMLHKANAVLKKYDRRTMDTAWDTPEFLGAMIAKIHASEQLDWLWQATFVDLAKEYKEGVLDARR